MDSPPVATGWPHNGWLKLNDLSAAQQRLALLGAILAGGAALLFAWPEHLPGLHLDEAWCFFRAQEIREGARPLDGMNYYTGALQQYLLAGAISLWGRHVWVARLLSGLFNLGMLCAYMQLVRQLHPGKNTWLWVGALTATSANFVIFSRFATEITQLTPFLIVTGSMLAQRGWCVARGGWAWALAGGVPLGLSIYNHMAAAALLAALGLAYLISTGWRCILDPRSYTLALGVAIGLTPRIVQILQLPPGQQGPAQRLLGNYTPDLLLDLLYIPEILRGMADGDLLYQNVAGRCLVWVLPFVSLALGLLLVVRLLTRRWRPARRDVGLWVAIAVASLLVTLISKGLCLRYFVLPVLALPYLLARASLSETSASVPGWARRLGSRTLAAVVTLQCFFIGVNYFYAHLSTGGKVSVFMLGKRLLETSDAYTRTDRLYKDLVSKDIQYVVAYDVIRWPMEYYDSKAGHFYGTAVPGWRNWHLAEDGNTAYVAYNGPLPMGGMSVDDFRGQTSIELDGHQLPMEPSADANFQIFVYRPGAAPSGK